MQHLDAAEDARRASAIEIVFHAGRSLGRRKGAPGPLGGEGSFAGEGSFRISAPLPGQGPRLDFSAATTVMVAAALYDHLGVWIPLSSAAGGALPSQGAPPPHMDALEAYLRRALRVLAAERAVVSLPSRSPARRRLRP